MTRVMLWNDFFALRRKLSKMKKIAGIPAAFTFLTAESALLQMPIFHPQETILSLDPIVFLGLATTCGTVFSYLIGGVVYKQIWARMHRADNIDMQLKQKDFYARIKRYRANVPPDPISPSNIDFYGEKISSVQEYREWLHKQLKLKNARIFK